MPESIALNIDCMEYMKTIPDKFFALAIVDPPYGSGDIITQGGTWSAKYKEKDSVWNVPPSKEYFEELFRVSQKQIIWGGNYFTLPSTRGFIVWRKLSISESFSMAMCEYAWSSFDKNAKIYSSIPEKGNRFHPAQKPIAVFEYCLKYAEAEKGWNILDTHLGSGSSRIACHKAGYDFVGCEIDRDYFDAQEKRFADYLKQIPMEFKK